MWQAIVWWLVGQGVVGQAELSVGLWVLPVITTDYLITQYDTQGIQVGAAPGQPVIFTVAWGTPLSVVTTVDAWFTLIYTTANCSSFYTPLVVNTTAADLIYIPWNVTTFEYIHTPWAANNIIPLLWLYQRSDTLSFNFQEAHIEGTFNRHYFAEPDMATLFSTSVPLCDALELTSPFACEFDMRWASTAVLAILEPGLPHVIVPRALVPTLDRTVTVCYVLDMQHGAGKVGVCSTDVVDNGGVPRYVLLVAEDITPANLCVDDRHIIVGTNLPLAPLAVHMFHALGPRVIIARAYVPPLKWDVTRMICTILVVLWLGVYFLWAGRYLEQHAKELVWRATEEYAVLLALGLVGVGWGIHLFVLYYYHYTADFEQRFYRAALSTDATLVDQWYWWMWVVFHLAAGLAIWLLVVRRRRAHWQSISHNLYLLGLVVAWSALMLDYNTLNQAEFTLGACVVFYLYHTTWSMLNFALACRDRYDVGYGLVWIAITAGFAPSLLLVFVNNLVVYFPNADTQETWLIVVVVLACTTFTFHRWIFTRDS
jgi:hypothetical protein